MSLRVRQSWQGPEEASADQAHTGRRRRKMRHVRYLLLLTVVSLAPALAFAGEQANAPSVTGETGLFTLLSGDTLPRGGWDFGLYFNNWDPLIKLDAGHGRNKELN